MLICQYTYTCTIHMNSSVAGLWTPKSVALFPSNTEVRSTTARDWSVAGGEKNTAVPPWFRRMDAPRVGMGMGIIWKMIGMYGMKQYGNHICNHAMKYIDHDI